MTLSFLAAAHVATSGLLALVALGFILGMRHATDPDHVIAVSTILTRERSLPRAAAIGAFWGLGHTLTILLVGGGFILFSVAVPPRLGLAMELCVAAMLLFLGAANLRTFLRSTRSANRSQAEGSIAHSHHHRHGDYIHSHPHRHDPEQHPHDENRTPVSAMDHTLGKLRGYRFARPLLIGVVHGLAGSAAVALLVLAAIPDPRWALGYLLVFGLGTVSGMVVITVAIASSLAWGARKFRSWPAYLGLAAGAASLAFGAFLIYEIGIVSGLFSANPHWMPH